MNVLVLQMKRIGDLVLTTPVFAALRAKFPDVRVTLIADEPCKSLLPALPGVDEALVYSRRVKNPDVWRAVRRGGWDVCLDFTETDRSALMAFLSRAKKRITFGGARWHRRLAFHEFVMSPVRLAHTCDRSLDLLRPLGIVRGLDAMPSLCVPDDERKSAFGELHGRVEPGAYALVHPGTARAEKDWLPERWAELIHGLRLRGIQSVITSGPDAAEALDAERIRSAAEARLASDAFASPTVILASPVVARPAKLSHLAALVEQARIVLSCDTSVVHLAAAFRRPQIALFGPTNPFHWRPRHGRAVVISAVQPDAPLTVFQPKMAGAPMDRIPAATVLSAAEALLSAPR